MKTKHILTAFIASLLCSSTFAAGKTGTKESTANLNARINTLEHQVKILSEKVSKSPAVKTDLDLTTEMYAHGPAVVTSPALGVKRSADDASDLFVAMSSVNADLALLQLRQQMDNYIAKKGLPIVERPIISLSGAVEGEGTYKRDYIPTEKFDVNLNRAELDVIGEASSWASAFAAMSYDSDPLSGGRRISNSRLRIDRGFVTLGQLNKLPVYLTVGQIYAPFGSYSTNMIGNPLTKSIGRILDRMVVLGYSKSGVMAQIFCLSGETKLDQSSDDTNILGHLGANLGYGFANDKVKFNIGASVVGNLAESDGMQKNAFNSMRYEVLRHQVPGFDGRVKFTYEPFTVLAEYVAALRSFDPIDMQFNGVGARPQAFAAEGAVDFKVKGKPNSFAVGYSQSWQALALKLPKHTLFAEYEISLFKNTVFAVEYRHDINYSSGNSANSCGNQLPVSVASMGSSTHQNIVTTRLGVYF